MNQLKELEEEEIGRTVKFAIDVIVLFSQTIFFNRKNFLNAYLRENKKKSKGKAKKGDEKFYYLSC